MKMKRKIFSLVLAGFLVFMSLPLSAFAEERQTEDKASSELITETPASEVENTDNEIVNQSKEDIVPDETEDAVVETDEKIEAEKNTIQEKDFLDESKQIEKDQKEGEAVVKKEVNASGDSFTEGEFTFTEDWYGSLYISKYSGQSEKIVVPAQTKDGRKVKGVSKLWDADNSEGKNKVESIVFSEGIEIIETGVLTGSGNALPNLMTLELPSTLGGLIYISNTGLTNLNCFEKVTKLSSISITDNPKLTDISALEKMSGVWYLNLRNNSELQDVSALKNLSDLQDLYLEGTKVSVQDQLDFLKLPEEVGVSVGLSRTVNVKPTLDIELDISVKDTTMAELTMEYRGYQSIFMKGLSAGKTEGIISARSNPDALRTFPIIVNALKPDQPVGDKVENLPQLEHSYTAMDSPRVETLGLYENGELWRINGGKQEKLLNNVKNYTGARVYTAYGRQSWALAQDKDNSLWIYETRGDNSTSVEKRLDNIIKYGGMFNSGADKTERACAIDKDQNLWQIDSNGGKDKLMAGVKDFAISHYYGMSKVLALNTKNELYLGDMVTKNFTKIADQVSELRQNFGALDDSKVTTYIQNGSLWGIKKDYSTGKAEIAAYEIGDHTLAVMGDFVVRSDGTTWYQKGDLSYQVLDKPVKQCATSTNVEATRKFEWLLDEDNILWRIERNPYSEKPLPIMPEKIIGGGVRKLYNSTGLYINYFEGYLLENGDYYNKNNKKIQSNVLDVYDKYTLKQDHVVYLEETAILDHVDSLYRGMDGLMMIRDDGSLWVSNYQGDATPYMLKDYIKEILVTGIKLIPSTLTLTQGYTAKLQAAIEPENATNQNVTWTSSHPDIASVENGLVAGVKEGEAVITATTEDGGKTAECKVTVKKAAPVLNPDSGTAEGITAGETGQAFAEKLKDSGAIEDKNQIKLYKADGQEVGLDTRLATGMKVVVTIGQKMFNRNAGTQEYTVIVLGDISGDGIINILDMLAAQDDILGKEKLEGCYRTAGDITKDNNINIMDMLAIQDDILGKDRRTGSGP